MTPAQPPLALAFPRRRAMGREDFVVGPPNAEAAEAVADPAGWPGGRLALVGPPGAGKTHLAHVLMAETGAARVEAAALTPDDVPALVAVGAVAVEDADRSLSPEAERAVLHLLNFAEAEGARALLTGATPPARWPARLPDLASRLAATAVARLAPPDEALLAAVIAKQLDDRRLAYDPALPEWLTARIERSFAAARAAVERLDALSLAERRNLTCRFASKVLPGLAGG